MVAGPSLGGTFGGRMVINPVELAAWMRSPSGPVVRELLRMGDVVKEGAQRRVGVSTPPPQGPRSSRRPGTLRDSIVKRLVTTGGEPTVMVGSEDDIAAFHHEGTDPHVIRGNPLLVFWSAKAGRVIYTRQVNHPGTKPNRFLVDALDDIRGG